LSKQLLDSDATGGVERACDPHRPHYLRGPPARVSLETGPFHFGGTGFLQADFSMQRTVAQ